MPTTKRQSLSAGKRTPRSAAAVKRSNPKVKVQPSGGRIRWIESGSRRRKSTTEPKQVISLARNLDSKLESLIKLDGETLVEGIVAPAGKKFWVIVPNSESGR